MACPFPSRRNFLALTVTTALQACAVVPDVDAYLPSPNDPDPLQRHYALQRALSDSPLVFGNQTSLLTDGAQALRAMFDAMRQARDHINLEYFILEDVAVGELHLSDLLIDRMKHAYCLIQECCREHIGCLIAMFPLHHLRQLRVTSDP